MISQQVSTKGNLDTVNHNVLLSNTVRLTLPEVTCRWVSNYIKGRQSVTNWGQQKEILLLTYKAFRISIANYTASVRSANASDTSLEKIQHTQNEALRIITCSHKIDHHHSETKMLLVEDHMNLLSAQYQVHCLDADNVCHITTMDHPPRETKATLFTRHN